MEKKTCPMFVQFKAINMQRISHFYTSDINDKYIQNMVRVKMHDSF